MLYFPEVKTGFVLDENCCNRLKRTVPFYCRGKLFYEVIYFSLFHLYNVNKVMFVSSDICHLYNVNKVMFVSSDICHLYNVNKVMFVNKVVEEDVCDTYVKKEILYIHLVIIFPMFPLVTIVTEYSGTSNSRPLLVVNGLVFN